MLSDKINNSIVKAILPPEPDPKEIMLQKSEFLAKLDFFLGEQKIDVMVETRYNRQLPIIKSAQANGIKL